MTLMKHYCKIKISDWFLQFLSQDENFGMPFQAKLCPCPRNSCRQGIHVEAFSKILKFFPTEIHFQIFTFSWVFVSDSLKQNENESIFLRKKTSQRCLIIKLCFSLFLATFQEETLTQDFPNKFYKIFQNSLLIKDLRETSLLREKCRY